MELVRHRQTKETVTDRLYLRDTAPVLDPTCSLALLISRRLAGYFDAEQMAEIAKVRDPAACHLIARICRFFLLSILAQELVEKILNFPQIHAEGEMLQRRGGFMELFERREGRFR